MSAPGESLVLCWCAFDQHCVTCLFFSSRSQENSGQRNGHVLFTCPLSMCRSPLLLPAAGLVATSRAVSSDTQATPHACSHTRYTLTTLCLLKPLFFRSVQLTDKEGKDKFEALKKDGATVVQVDYKSPDNLVKALEGVEIVVSAIGGNGVIS